MKQLFRPPFHQNFQKKSYYFGACHQFFNCSLFLNKYRMLRHSFLRVGEDIPLQHIVLPQCSFYPPSSYWVARGNKGSKFQNCKNHSRKKLNLLKIKLLKCFFAYSSQLFLTSCLKKVQSPPILLKLLLTVLVLVSFFYQ